eukprot:CAMPEP_0197641358 /NCGR_PEP_ID=MMETSP1338-20131121/15349_1 /TAXON_ID=43686 ORGANISM="Pelagodinium beii, Strain RCC1491" /NCGR_SAMPLE_ID=MMETSP1338 /ASSEMBLY_ACC=CAM_ASM_000754 /LENGTH=1915 /DNA_ID=CAMNT_0043214331 /DNA_START=81 /DNA_END=5831 /DNA_ORIENTATION=+
MAARLLLCSFGIAVGAARIDINAHAATPKLCSQGVVQRACTAMGASESELFVSRAQMAELLSRSETDLDLLLFSLGMDGREHLWCQELCEAAVSAIPGVLNEAVPTAVDMACLDEDCEDSEDVSEGSLGELVIPSQDDAEDHVAPQEAVAETQKEHPESLLRHALNVLFHIFPAPDEVDNFQERGSSFLEADPKDKKPVATFGDTIEQDKHKSVRRQTVKAAAFVASAIRNMDSRADVVKRWFSISDNKQLKKITKDVKTKLNQMQEALGQVHYKKGESSKCTGKTFAYVTHTPPKENDRWIVHLCDYYWKVVDDERIGTLIHEISHHFGTTDEPMPDGKGKAYGEEKCLKLETHQAIRNADNYMFLVKDLSKSEGAITFTDEASRLVRVEELKKELSELVGLDAVKSAMNTLLDLVEFGKVRQQRGLSDFGGQSLHMRFLGNPGTGKTVVARIVGELLLAMSAIRPKEGNATSFKFTEASRADLVAEFKGQTAIKVQKLVQESLGGVLFIDEAYALVQGPQDSFGVEAVDTLIKEMEDNRAHIIVILAGYSKEMEDFFNSNPGFRSRVPFSFKFEDYSCPELTKIGQLQLKSKGLALSDPDGLCLEGSSCWWLRRSSQLTTQCCDEEDKSNCLVKEDRTNGNGRAVRNILESSFRQMSLRVLKQTPVSDLRSFATELGKKRSSGDVPDADCSSPHEVNFGSYNGADLRCSFMRLEASDLINTTTAIMNLNIVPCRMSLGRDEVAEMAKKKDAWNSLGNTVTKITLARSESETALKAACRSLKQTVNDHVVEAPRKYKKGPPRRLAQVVTRKKDDSSDTRTLFKKDTGALGDFVKLHRKGFCMDSAHRKITPFDTKSATLPKCAELCKSKDGCNGFAFQSPGDTCYLYNSKVPSASGGRMSLTCYVSSRHAAAAGVGVGTIQGSRRPGAQTRPPLPAIPTKPAGTKYTSRPPRTPAAPEIGKYGDKENAEDMLDDVTLPGGSNEKVDELMGKLNRLVGLAKVKLGMAELRAMVDFDQWRKTLLPDAKSLMGQSFHMQFLGNPGTGKTVVARIVGELLVEMGVIDKEEGEDEPVFEEVARADLVAEYKGQTAPKVVAAVDKAVGGVLFIDEAYSLKKEGKDAFGQEAVDTLIKEIEDKRDKVIAIFAGYEDEMETFFDANPGFKSRVPFKFYFDDYTCSELHKMAGVFMEDKAFTASEGADLWLKRTIGFSTGCCDKGECQATRDNGNGRTVRNILEASYRNFAGRVVPGIARSKDFKPLMDRLQTFAEDRRKAKPEYEIKHGVSKRTREKLEQDFGLEAVCSDEKSPAGASWKELCKSSKSKLTELEAEDVTLVAATKSLDMLLASCRDAKRDLNVLEDLASSVLQVVTEEEWQEIEKNVIAKDCDGTFEALEAVSNPPARPKYDTLSLMEDEEDLKEVLSKLKKLVGLSSVKDAMGKLFGLVKLSTWRSGLGMASLSGQSFHMRFLGNPGTGKTVVARIVGEMLVKMKVVTMPEATRKALEEQVKNQTKAEGKELPKGAPVELPMVFREISRVDLVASYSGQTAPKVEQAVENALGGVLFIDEAYALVRDGKDNFGQEAVDTLIKEMEDKRKNVIVILAGYETEMDTFFDSNPGFKSRVPFTFRFEDYSCKELGQIGKMVMDGQGLMMPSSVIPGMNKLVEFASGCCEDVGDADCHPSRDNGNGRTVRNVVEAISRAMATRVIKTQKETKGEIPTSALTQVATADIMTVAEQQASMRLEGPCGQEGLVTQLSVASERSDGLRGWFSKYKLSDPAQQLHRVVRETNRMSKSLTSFDSDRIRELNGQCSTGLSRLLEALQNKLTSTCSASGSLTKLAEDVNPERSLTVDSFRRKIAEIERSSHEAQLLQKLLIAEDVPAPLSRLQNEVDECESSLDGIRSKSLLAPLEATVVSLRG